MTEHLREELLGIELSALDEVERQLDMLQNFATAQDDVFERQRRLMLQHSEIETRVARLRDAPEGEEFLLRVVSTLIELRVGDNFLEKMNAQILLHDGVVVGLSRPQSAVESADTQLEPQRVS